MSSTGAQIRVAVGRQIRQDSTNDEYLKEVVTTSTSAVVDTANLEGTSRYNSGSFRGWAVRGQTSGVRSYGDVLTVATGSLSISPSATLTSSEPIELWHPDMPDPDEIDKARDRALSQLCTQWRMEPLTWLQDGDFEASGVTNWTGSNATATKTTPTTDVERVGDQVLNVANSAGNGYAGQTINVAASNTWFVFAVGRATTGTAVLTMQDLTNAASVSLAGLNRSTWASPQWGIMTGTVTIPAGCQTMSVRLGGSGSGDVSQWAMVCLYPQDMANMPLPSRISNSSWVGTFYTCNGTDEYAEAQFTPLLRQPKVRQIGGGYVGVDFGYAAGGRPLFYGEFANYAALQTAYNTTAGRQTGDAATTSCPLEYVKWATLYDLFGGEVAITGRGQLHLYEKYKEKFESAHRMFGAQKEVRFTRDAEGYATAYGV